MQTPAQRVLTWPTKQSSTVNIGEWSTVDTRYLDIGYLDSQDMSAYL